MYRVTETSSGIYSKEIDLDRAEDISDIETLAQEGEVVMIVADLEDLSEIGINAEDVINVEDE